MGKRAKKSETGVERSHYQIIYLVVDIRQIELGRRLSNKLWSQMDANPKTTRMVDNRSISRGTSIYFSSDVIRVKWKD